MRISRYSTCKSSFHRTRKLIGLATFLLLVLQAFIASAQEKQAPKLELEVDPLAYLLKGYSFHAGLTYGSFRSSLGIFAIEQPAFFIGNDDFEVYSSGFDLKTDLLFGKANCLHAGLQLTYGKDRINHKNSQEEEELWGLNIGLRAGYRFLLGNQAKDYRGFYLNPWLALIYSPGATSVTKGAQQYQQPRFSPFPAVHIGWRF